MGVSKFILNLLHPVLRILYTWYAARKRLYTFRKINITVHSGVFHPGLFFSTKILLNFLEKQHLKGKRILELGAGTGLISIFCRMEGAEKVCASDISQIAIKNIIENATMNNVDIKIIQSDIFDDISPNDFDIIIINPPYYAKKIETEKNYSWFCGENFEYFQKLFMQLKQKRTTHNCTYMILSEDCDIDTINDLALKNNLLLKELLATRTLGELNYIYLING